MILELKGIYKEYLYNEVRKVYARRLKSIHFSNVRQSGSLIVSVIDSVR